jgi:predicted TIM-barrel fold metal-dependent hydrolase
MMNRFTFTSDFGSSLAIGSDSSIELTESRRRFLLAAGSMLTGAAFGAQASAKVAGPNRKHSSHSRRIDVHHHYVPPQYLSEGPPSTARTKVDNWSPGRAIEDMDLAGVALAVLSFSTPYLWYPGAEGGRRLARLCNDYSAQMVRDYPRRFGLFAGIPPVIDIEGCLREIEYALDTLHSQGITLMTSYGDAWLGDAAFAPVLEELNARKAVVFVHPATPNCCTSLLPGVPSNYVESPFDTSRTVTSLWFSGALERWPDIRFVFSHGGGALPMIADRIDKAGRPGKEPHVFLHDANTQIRNLYFDTANAANPPALAALQSLADPSHILFGTDYPYVPLAQGIDDLARAKMPTNVRQAIESGNALALMPSLAT